MAATHGNNGVVKVGSNAVALVTAWNLEESIETPEITAMGDASRDYLSGGPVGASGSVSCLFDVADTTGQGALTTGAEVTLNLFQDGDASGKQQRACTAIVGKRAISTEMSDAVKIDFDFVVKGAVTVSTVA